MVDVGGQGPRDATMRSLCALFFLVGVAWGDTSTGKTTGRTASEQPRTIEYHAPDGKAADADFRFSELKKGDRVWLAATGAPVTITEVLGRERDGDRVNLRYGVRRPDGSEAKVFGGDLTPLRVEADLDGDGKPEVAILSFSASFQLRVMVIKNGSAAELELEPAGQGYLSQKGGWGALAFVGDAGIPLLRIDSRPEACSDFTVTYVSDVGGKLQPALVLTGLADPPNHSIPSVKFDAKTKTAVVTQTNSEEDDKGRTHSKRTLTRYRLEPDGVFREVATEKKGTPAGRRSEKK
jgi:hypothetical protein